MKKTLTLIALLAASFCFAGIDLQPDPSNRGNLGASTNKWESLYVGKLYADTNATTTNIIFGFVERVGSSVLVGSTVPGSVGLTNGYGLSPSGGFTTAYVDYIVPIPTGTKSVVGKAMLYAPVGATNDGLGVAMCFTNSAYQLTFSTNSSDYFPTSNSYLVTNQNFTLSDMGTSGSLWLNTWTLTANANTNGSLILRVARKGSEAFDTYTNYIFVEKVWVEVTQ